MTGKEFVQFLLSNPGYHCATNKHGIVREYQINERLELVSRYPGDFVRFVGPIDRIKMLEPLEVELP